MSAEVALLAVRVRYGPLEALHGVDLAVPSGGVTVLLGRNGSGRTSVLHALAGLVRPAAGRVVWRGRDVTALGVHQRVRLGLALVPAERAVFPSLTVAEHLALAAPTRGGPARGGPAREALALFPELAALLPRPAGTLSGGQQQLVAVARALTTAPTLLLLDEPDRGLAPAVAARLHAHLLSSSAATGRTVVLTAQTLPPALAPAAAVHVLHRGELTFSGEPAETGTPPDAPR
ncbi:ATP-binding cassette domain-containing protein [Kitasatospora sp. NPDC002551]|uniref:ATP-binding cassette domain-containing protein n=1 Tax=unclassified Kitasatospora TaxID=2633591 RepID=UPI0033272A39